MLFNSFEFIFIFLPVALVTYFTVERYVSRMWAIASLGALSIFFYGWWDYRFVWIIILSVVVNFALSRVILARNDRLSYVTTIVGVVLNLGLLFYFKYLYFFIGIVTMTAGMEFTSINVVLPIGISFFTFQQIAFLIDTYARKCDEANFPNYVLFVTFFPQLIAGPIVHHSEMMPQFAKPRTDTLVSNLVVGLTIFVIGLSKKMLLADTFATYSSPVHAAAAAGEVIQFWQGWIAAVSYTLQIYFDFSGYSDMAIGIARMFGIKLPINFASPYKSTTIGEFWRRWHITLSRFLRDYIYIPLGGSRKGARRAYINVFATMFIGGLWHGAAWTYVIWGALQGLAVVVDHFWQRLPDRYRPGRYLGWFLTFLFLVLTFVVFRAETLSAAGAMFQGMFGFNGISVPSAWAVYLDAHETLARTFGLHAGGVPLLSWNTWVPLVGGMAIILLAPNTQTLMRNFEPGLVSPKYPDPYEQAPVIRLSWTAAAGHALFFGTLFSMCVAKLTDVSEFIYFQF